MRQQFSFKPKLSFKKQLVKPGVSTLKVQTETRFTRCIVVQCAGSFPVSIIAYAGPHAPVPPADDKCHLAERILPLQHRIGEADQVTERPHLPTVGVATKHEVYAGLRALVTPFA